MAPKTDGAYVVTEFKGVDTAANPLSLPLGYSDKSFNVYSHGGALYKRPGLKKWTGTAFGGALIDIVPWRAYGAGGGNAQESIFAIVRVTAFGVTPVTSKVQYVTLMNQAMVNAPVDVTGTSTIGGVRGDAYAQELVPCDALIWRTGPTPRVIVPATAGTYPPYWKEAAPAASPTIAFDSAAWHKRTLFHFMADSSSAKLARYEYSDFNLPETYPAANNDQQDPEGLMHAMRAGFSVGEHMYLLSAKYLYILTGATAEKFRVEHLATSFGMVGRRSMCAVKNTVLGWAARRRDGNNTFSPSYPSYAVVNIAALSGMQAELIGDKLKGFLPMGQNLGSNGVPQIPIDVRFELTRACYDPARDLAMFLMQAYMHPYSSPNLQYVMVLNTEGAGGEWFPWQLFGVGISCMMAHCDLTFFGCEDGNLRVLDSTYGVDDIFLPTQFGGTQTTLAFESAWYSSWLNRDDKKIAIEECCVWGDQTSGNTLWELWAEIPGKNPFLVRSFDFDQAGAELGLSGDIEAHGIVRLFVKFPLGAVGCKMTKFACGPKGVKYVGASGE